MSSKVKCSSCGWSWSKSDSSKKDANVCHICGKDNTMKDGGWLDKYQEGGELNYNDYSVSAGEGFQGDGYSNVGRNYSPAWGGQFKEGGELPNVTVKGKRQPIIVTDPNDPRLKAYQDSLSLYNISKDAEAKLAKITASAYKKTGFDKSSVNDALFEGKDIILHPEKYLKKGSSGYIEKYNKKGLYYESEPDMEYLGTPQSPATIKDLIKYNKKDIKDNTPYINSLDEDVNGHTHRDRIELAKIASDALEKEYKIVKRTGYNPTYFIPNAERSPNLIFKKPTQPVVYRPESTPQSTIDFMEGNYGQEPITEIPQPQPQASAYGEVIDPRTGYTHMTRQGSPMYPLVGQKVPEMKDGGNLSFIKDPKLRNMLEGYKPGFMNTVGDYRLPEGRMTGNTNPSSEVSTSVGGEQGEPGYLIPSFKYGSPLQDPTQEFNMTGQHLGGPFKTWQDAEKFQEIRHQYVEKGQPLPSPIATANMAMGGSLPGATGSMYARVGAPSEDKGRNKVYKTDASAQNGKEMQFYQEGLDFKPKSISKNGSKIIKDDRGQWDHPGEITEIGSNQITMQGVPYPVMGISDTGDMQMMYPNQEYQYDGNSVTEYPMMAEGGNNPKLTDIEKIGYMWQSPNSLKTGDAEGKSEYVNKIKNYYELLNAKKMEQGGQLTKLDQLTNFTNYNTKQPGGWLDKYQ